jgi:trans-aconitate methyltransferase
MTDSTKQAAEFDSFADDYDASLERGISISGESKDYFAEKRVEWTSRCLAAKGCEPSAIVDYGCGTGSGIGHLLTLSPKATVLGVDVSENSLEVARSCNPSERVAFEHIDRFEHENQSDLVFCNGVFHHIHPEKRQDALMRIQKCLKPGGYFAFWENNPWNPGTKIVMSRIPFDRDAVTISIPEAQMLLRGAGFQVLRTDTRFYFPRILSFLRVTEGMLGRLPLGAQYMVLGKKPMTEAGGY